MSKPFLKPALALLLSVTASVASAVPMLSFIIDGDTFTQPYKITNSSTAGESVVRFQLDLSPVNMVFDTVTGGAPGNGTIGVPVTPVGSSAATTGLVSPYSHADGASLLDLLFTNFGAGESFSWDVDVDGASGSPVTVYGNMLIGALATIDFSDGQRLTGVLAAVAGNADASQFTVTGITQTPQVPEPGSLALLALGMTGLALSRRKARA